MLFLTGNLVLLWIWLPQSQEIWALPWIALVITFSLLSILKHYAILIFFLHISFQNTSPCHYALMHSKFHNMFLTYSCGYLLHMAIQNLTSGPNYHIPQYHKLFKEAREQVAWVIFILHWKENEIKKERKKYLHVSGQIIPFSICPLWRVTFSQWKLVFRSLLTSTISKVVFEFSNI